MVQSFGLRYVAACSTFLLFVSLRAEAFVALEQGEWKFLVGGFVEFDALYDSTQSFAETVGNNAVSRPDTLAGQNNRTQFSIRNSRISFGFSAPPQDDWKTRAYLEMDFLGYNPAPAAGVNTEIALFTNSTPRLRHAYISAEKNDWQILAGQYWGLLGWQPVYVLPTVSVNPIVGVLYERLPQLTVLKKLSLSESNRLQFGLSLARPPERDSGVPAIDGGLRLLFDGRRAGYALPTGERTSEPMSLALSGTCRDFAVPSPGNLTSYTHYLGYAAAADILVPLIAAEARETANSLALTAEYTVGRGYADEYPGWTGNLPQFANGGNSPTQPNLDAGQGGFDGAGAFHLVEMQTANAGLQFHLPETWKTFLGLGYARLWSTNLTSLRASAGKIIYDRVGTAYVNLFHEFTSQVRAGAEYGYYQTHYLDEVSAHNHRIQVSGWFRF
jgi:hypothetical protein